MSLCEACRKVLPNIPASDANEDSIAAISKAQSRNGVWHREEYPGYPKTEERWYLSGDLVLHSSWESLILSLSHDCPICWTLWRRIRSCPIADPNIERTTDFKAMFAWIKCIPIRREYYVIINLEGHRLSIGQLRFSLWETTRRCYLEAEREFPLPVQHTPKSAADLAKRWYKMCEAKHSQCLKLAAPPENAKMPTRLLDLGAFRSNAWRLCQDPGHVPYVALSHRWSSDTPELHTGNYKNYCNFQPDSALPQNYQEIISICRALPIQYLWIDSLCIIQDDNGHEFSKEAPLMKDIYQYAFLTLSICWEFPGLSIFRSCRPRSVPRPRPQSLVYDVEDDFVSESDDWLFVEESEPQELQVHVTGAPINRRAWVLQERCLSRRLLYLGNDQLYWECDGCTGSEVSPDGIPKIGGRHSILDLTGQHKDAAWRQTLALYTRSELTFETDRLIAIAGLAKLIASKTGSTYLAGIWLDSWMQDLLWEPIEELDRSLKLKPEEQGMIPPSWSWLGFSGWVESGIIMGGEGPKITTVNPNSFRSDECQPLALLSQAVVIPPTSDPFSSFEQAILKIRCLLLPVTFTGSPHRDKQPWFFRHQYDTETSSIGLDCFRLQACEPCSILHVTFRLCFSQPVDMSLQYFLLPLYRRHDLRGGAQPAAVFGLVLQKRLSGDKQEFVRVGMWSEYLGLWSQLSPMISNTIVKLGIGKGSTLSDECLTENERVFDLKLGEDAVGYVASKVPFQGKLVECSLLPHFTTAQWGTISLV